MTVWSFTSSITAYGGDFTLGGPGGSGNSLLVYIDDSPTVTGSISNSYNGGFWGFISDTTIPIDNPAVAIGSSTRAARVAVTATPPANDRHISMLTHAKRLKRVPGVGAYAIIAIGFVSGRSTGQVKTRHSVSGGKCSTTRRTDTPGIAARIDSTANSTAGVGWPAPRSTACCGQRSLSGGRSA
ncbi:hypothetical protein [Novipirellula artificiosorum]|uniref:Uncharacterized protein n=1 Tax=Novipirellula artificiosorum TaxID=2528016 RepID=A0A5C6E0S4_9BACT|nr:hypothetical protein [Novipirellula artificiosorum]TWU40946.1 hypothetical protein Poly41_17810 [Novipirellula artificiosorum]